MNRNRVSHGIAAFKSPTDVTGSRDLLVWFMGEPQPSSVRAARVVSRRHVNPFAIVSLVCAVSSPLILPIIPAIMFGHFAYSEIRRDPTQRGKWIAVTSLVLAYTFLAVFLVLLIWFWRTGWLDDDLVGGNRH